MCLFELVGCGGGGGGGSGSSSGRASGDALASLDCRNKDGAKLELLDDGLRHIPAEDLVVRQDDAPLSLCGTMRANPNVKLTMFFFTSLECYQCTKWIDQIYGEAESYSLDLLPVVILAGDPLRTTQADVGGLKAQVAGDAVWARDTSGDVWRFFAPDSPSVVPTLVLMDGAARGVTITDQKTNLKAIIDKANTLMKLGLKPVP